MRFSDRILGYVLTPDCLPSSIQLATIFLSDLSTSSGDFRRGDKSPCPKTTTTATTSRLPRPPPPAEGGHLINIVITHREFFSPPGSGSAGSSQPRIGRLGAVVVVVAHAGDSYPSVRTYHISIARAIETFLLVLTDETRMTDDDDTICRLVVVVSFSRRTHCNS